MVSDNGRIYIEQVFCLKHNDKFYCSVENDNKTKLYGWKYAKPFPSKESILEPIVEQLKAEAKKLGIENVKITFE